MKNPPPDIDYHTNGTKRGEEWTYEGRKEPGMEGDKRTARDATGINANKRRPIDPRMPDLPPAQQAPHRCAARHRCSAHHTGSALLKG